MYKNDRHMPCKNIILEIINPWFFLLCSTKRVNHFMSEEHALGWKELKPVHMVATRWLSLCGALDRIDQTYDALVKTFSNDPGTTESLEYQALDLEVILGITGVLPLLKELVKFIQASQCRGIFILGLLRDLQYLRSRIKQLYLDPKTKFKGETGTTLE